MRSRGYERLAAFDVAQPALAKLAGLGIECYADAAERLPDAAFDCIRLEHVLEHMVDPVGTLSLLARKLSSTGTIVLAVPNFGSYSASKLGANWQALKLPHHLSHFTVQALSRVAKRAGLGLKRVRFLPISELGVQRPRGAARRVVWQAERFRYHLRHMGAPSGDFLSAELEVLG
jgi:hypothetical protein